MKQKNVLPFAALALISVGLIWDSKYNLALSEYCLSFKELPAAFDGYRVLHLSDLHGARFGEKNRRLASMVREARADLVVFTGDMAGNRRQMKAVEELLTGIEGVAPMFCVSGNHEWTGRIGEEMEALMARHNVCCLIDSYVPIERSGERIVICGAEDPRRGDAVKAPPELARQLRKDYPEDFVLWLCHRNTYFETCPNLPAQLLLCGHAHGGIVRLPGIGGLFSTHHRLFAEYESGIYEGASYTMEVSRGLGNSVPVPRLFNRPELVCLELRAKA